MILLYNKYDLIVLQFEVDFYSSFLIKYTLPLFRFNHLVIRYSMKQEQEMMRGAWHNSITLNMNLNEQLN